MSAAARCCCRHQRGIKQEYDAMEGWVVREIQIIISSAGAINFRLCTTRDVVTTTTRDYYYGDTCDKQATTMAWMTCFEIWNVLLLPVFNTGWAMSWFPSKPSLKLILRLTCFLYCAQLAEILTCTAPEVTGKLLKTYENFKQTMFDKIIHQSNLNFVFLLII